MGHPGAYFEGRVYFIPGARGKFKSKALKRGASLDNNTLVLIGPASNGFDCNDSTLDYENRVMEFTSFAEAKEILGSGDLLDAIKGAFSPSKDQRFSPGPQLVKALNISPNIRASITLDGHTVKALVPGPDGNKLRILIESSDKIVVSDGVEKISQDGLLQPDISISYTGDGTAADLTFDGNTLAVTVTGSTDGSASFSLSISEYPTLADLYDKINSLTGFTAGVESKPDFLSKNLDVVASTTVIGGLSLYGTFYRQKTFLENTGAFEVVSSSNTPFSVTASYQYLSGGSTGVWANQDYLDAIEFSKEVSGLYRNVCTDTFSIASYLSEIVNWMNSPDGSRETFGGAGADTSSLSVQDRIDQAKAINNEFMVYGVSPVKNYESDGLTEKTFTGWYISVLHNAAKAATNPRESLTHKDLNIISCPELLSDNDKRKIIQAGGLYVDRKPNKGAWKIGFALTTYQKSDTILTQASKVCTALAMSKDLRESLEESFLAEIVDDNDIRLFVDNKLDEYENLYGYLSKNIYTGEPAYDPNYTIERDGDKVYFVFPDAKLVSPINFFFHLFNLSEVKGSSTGGN